MKQLKNLLSKISLPAWLSANESGQSMIILTFAFLGLLAMLGLALDLGLVYVERTRLKRAVDAAVLAAATDLPVEEEAMRRAVDFLEENGYKNANIYVAGCIQDIYGTNTISGTSDNLMNWPGDTAFYKDLRQGDNVALITETLSVSPTLFYLYAGPGAADPSAPAFFIDTRSFQVRTQKPGLPVVSSGRSAQCGQDDQAFTSIANTKNYGSSSRIKVSGQIPVTMNFMRFFGWDSALVADGATAQNAANLDVAVVLDVTGSMAFDTICFGCWARCDTIGACPSTDRYLPYPSNGRSYPIIYDDLKDPYICGSANGGDCTPPPPPSMAPFTTPADPKPEGANDYIIIEAELYSNNSSVWDPAFRGADQGYWAMQRNDTSNTTSVDARGAYVRHHPYYQTSDSLQPFGHRYLIADAQSGAAPRLDYDFMPTWDTGNTTYIYLKVRYFSTGRNDNPDDEIYWAVDNGAIQPNTAAYTTGGWGWIKLNAGSGLQKDAIHTLKIWAGSPGYYIDRIIVTTRNIADMGSNALRDDPATAGSAQRLAADPCNPIFGLSVSAADCTYMQLSSPSVNNLNDPLLGDLQPIRGAKEAVRAFVDRLEPDLDQAGFVRFSADATQESQLECLQASQSRESVAGDDVQAEHYPLDDVIMGVEYDETACFDAGIAAPNTVPIEFTNVFIGIENAGAGGNTDIADGLRRGLHMLGVTTDDDGAQDDDCDWTRSGTNWSAGGSSWRIGGQTQPAANIDSHCTRGQAATTVLVLLTDGAPTNGDPGDNDECRAWGVSNPKPYDEFPITDNMYECIMYYAEIAGNNGIIIYTIGLGAGADPDLLRAVAEETNGQYYFAPSSAQLNIIFNQILANIYIRLIG